MKTKIAAIRTHLHESIHRVVLSTWIVENVDADHHQILDRRGAAPEFTTLN